MRPSRIAAFLISVGLILLVAHLLRERSHTAQSRPASSRDSMPHSDGVSAGLSPPDELAPSLPQELRAVSGGSQRSAIPGPHGRVIEAGTDRPIVGLSVQLRLGGKVLAEAVTASNGSFSLPEPERSPSMVEVISEEWRITPRRYLLDKKHSSAAEIIFEGKHIVASPLRGRLLDRKTGEPIPEFLIQARGPCVGMQELATPGDPGEDRPDVTFQFRPPPRRVENIVTSEDGGFESAGSFEAGLLDLLLVDHPSFPEGAVSHLSNMRSIEHRHAFEETEAPEEVELEIAIGPTYRLDVVLPAGTSMDDFYATFPTPHPGLRELHRAVAGDPGSPMALFNGSALKPNALELQAPLRDGELIWVRFRDPVLRVRDLQKSAGGYAFEVRSRDGHWAGRASVSSFEGIYPGVVPITMEGRGAVEGIVLDGDGMAVPTAWIQLFTTSAASSPISETGADAKGAFAFKWLLEGAYEVVVETDRYEQSRSPISIERGATEHFDVRLNAKVPLGTVSGVLRSRTGQHRSKGGVVLLRSLDDPDFLLFKTVSYRKLQGEYEAAFAFEDVPNGNYELSLKPLDNLRWNALSIRIVSPAEALEFICEDDVPTFDLEFRAIDAQTGASIEKSWNIVWQGDPLDDGRLEEDWETGLYKEVPEGMPLQWVLRAKGYRLATGDETNIITEADHRVVRARLKRGWGQSFKVTTREREPIEGAELVVDGDSIGVTDAQGRVSINLDAKPGVLEFRYKDWAVTWGCVDPNEDEFG